MKEKTIIHLVLKKKYFKQIYEGTKTVEYRDHSPHWQRRIDGRHFTHIRFQLGYDKNPPTMLVKIHDRNVIDYKDELAYAFDLGVITEVLNYPPPTTDDNETL